MCLMDLFSCVHASRCVQFTPTADSKRVMMGSTKLRYEIENRDILKYVEGKRLEWIKEVAGMISR